jgi:hypothetical protein
MPQAEIRVFRDAGGGCPLQEWLHKLRRRQPKAYAKCLARILDLAREGNELRRPLADYLRDGIRELRIRSGRTNLRILYGFVGKQIALLTHGLTMQAEVPDADIEFAIECFELARRNPDRFTSEFEV